MERICKLFAIIGALALAGCASMYGGMDAAAIAAESKNKNSVIMCGLIPTPWGLSKIVTVNHDEVRGVDGAVSVDVNCAVTTNTATPPRPAPPVAPKEPAK